MKHLVKRITKILCSFAMILSAFVGMNTQEVQASELSNELYAAFTSSDSWKAPITVGDGGSYYVAYCFNAHREAPPANQNDPYTGQPMDCQETIKDGLIGTQVNTVASVNCQMQLMRI